jgi:hypothetical protein
MFPEPLPGLGVVGAVVDGDALVEGDDDGPTSGDTVGAGDAAACATTNVPNPPARPTLSAITIFAIGPRNHPGLFIA